MDTYFNHEFFTNSEADDIGRKMPCGIFGYRITKEKTVLDFFPSPPLSFFLTAEMNLYHFPKKIPSL